MKYLWDYDVEKVIANAKQQVANARIMGQFTVQMGSAELARRAQELQVLIQGFCEDAGLIAKAQGLDLKKSDLSTVSVKKDEEKQAAVKKASAKKPAAKKAPAKKPAAKKAPAKKPAGKKAAPKKVAAKGAALALRDYDTLAASQIVPRLGALSSSELETIRTHELAHRSRKTILGRIAQLQS